MARDTSASLEPSTARAFVGRERELAELRGGLDDALTGRGRLFLILGEPGIGKTRLAEELAAGARARGAQVLWGRCWESGGAPVYWPWVQVIRTLARTHDAPSLTRHVGAGAPHLVQMVPELRQQLGIAVDVPVASTLASEHARFPLFDATTALFKSVAGTQPLVIVLDDLHAADQPSLLLLQFLSRELQDARILIVGTYREVDMQRQPDAARVVSDVARRGHRIPLTGLSADDVGRFMQTIFSLSPSPALAAAVHQTTEGNPFFVDEVVRLLVAEDPLHPPGDLPVGGLHIPHGVRDAIRERLGPLSSLCQRVVTTAAVIGREFTLAGLQGSTELNAEELLDVLQEAEAGGIVAKRPGSLPRYRFKHALIRETLYEDLPAGQRMLLHRRIGEVLECLYTADRQPHLAELAHHFLQAAPSGDADKAIEYAIQAGERAAALLAYEEAAVCYTHAIEVLALQPSGSETRRIELLLALGETQTRAWNSDHARATFQRAADAARRLAHNDATHASTLLARAALGIGRTGLGIPRGGVVDHELVALLEEALRVLDERDSSLRAQILARLAVELYFSDSVARRIALSSEAVDMARRVGDVTTLAYVVNARHFALWDSPDMGERLDVAAEAVALAERAGDLELIMQGHCWWLLDAIELGDTAAWDRELEVIAQLAERLRQARSLSLTATLRGMRALWRGQFDDVETFAQQSLAIGNRVQDSASMVNAGLQMFLVSRARGRHAALEPMVKGWVERLPSNAVTRCILAILYADLGREAEARGEFELLAAQDFVELQRVNGLNALLPWFAELCAFLADTARAGLLLEYLQPVATRNILGGPRICFGPATHALGLVTATLGRWDAAAQHFEDALTRSTQMRGAPAVATTQYEYARMLLSRRQPGDRQRAIDLLSQAEATATALGMHGLAEKTRAGTQTAHALPDAPRTGPQQEVRRAVAAGGGRPDAPQTEAAAEPPASARVLHFPTQRDRKMAAAPAEARDLSRTDVRAPTHRTSDDGIFRREGEYWSVGDSTSIVRLKDTKGLCYIAQLLRHPGREFHVTDLIAPEQPPAASPITQMSDAQLLQLGMRPAASAATEPLLDAAAKAAYKRRIEDLRDQLEEATRFNDTERAAQARREIDFLGQELARAVGLGGRDRMAASHAERTRLNVTRAIKSVVKRISASNKNLGRYLATTIKTGTFCSYNPDPRIPMTWKL